MNEAPLHLAFRPKKAVAAQTFNDDASRKRDPFFGDVGSSGFQENMEGLQREEVASLWYDSGVESASKSCPVLDTSSTTSITKPNASQSAGYFATASTSDNPGPDLMPRKPTTKRNTDWMSQYFVTTSTSNNAGSHLVPWKPAMKRNTGWMSKYFAATSTSSTSNDSGSHLTPRKLATTLSSPATSQSQTSSAPIDRFTGSLSQRRIQGADSMIHKRPRPIIMADHARIRASNARLRSRLLHQSERRLLSRPVSHNRLPQHETGQEEEDDEEESGVESNDGAKKEEDH